MRFIFVIRDFDVGLVYKAIIICLILTNEKKYLLAISISEISTGV